MAFHTQKIHELDEVQLKINIPSEGLHKGDCGRVVMLYGTPVKDADVEFPNPETGGVSLVLVPMKWLEIVCEETDEEQQVARNDE